MAALLIAGWVAVRPCAVPASMTRRGPRSHRQASLTAEAMALDRGDVCEVKAAGVRRPTGSSADVRSPGPQGRRGMAGFCRKDYDANVDSTNLIVGIGHSYPVPLHARVAGASRRAIAGGEARPGERLSPAGPGRRARVHR